MRCVLGIDAAWTVEQPSGCALVDETATGWRLVSCAASIPRVLTASSNGVGRKGRSDPTPGVTEHTLLRARVALPDGERPVRLGGVRESPHDEPSVVRKPGDGSICDRPP